MKSKNMLLKINILIITTFIFIFSFSDFLSAQLNNTENVTVKESKAVQNIGVIDLGLIYSLHPVMQYYDSKSGLFFKPVSTQGPDLDKLIASKLEEYKKNSEACLSKNKELNAEIEKTNYEINLVNTKKYSTTFDTESSPTKTEALKKYDHDLEQLKTKLLTLNEQLKDNLKKLMESSYLTIEENKKCLKKLNEEIYETANQIATKHNIVSVINMPLPIGSKINNKSDFTLNSSIENLGSYNEKNPIELSKLINGPDYGKISKFLFPENYTEQEINNNLKKIYSGKNKLKLKNSSQNKLIISGGIDLTFEVIMAIYQKHNSSPDEINRLKVLLNKLEN